jgi:predicted DNA-binding transcriptional regulator AlpA
MWRVSIDLDTGVEVTPTQADAVVDQLERYGAALGYGPVAVPGAAEPGAAVVYDETRLSITLTVETSSGNPLRAGELGRQIVSRAVAAAGASIANWLGVEAITDDEADRRLADPPIPELISTPEAGEILGVSRQRVHQLRQREDFPSPVVELGSGPVWTQTSIEAFDESWNRKPGRPPGMAPEASEAETSE